MKNEDSLRNENYQIIQSELTKQVTSRVGRIKFKTPPFIMIPTEKSYKEE